MTRSGKTRNAKARIRALAHARPVVLARAGARCETCGVTLNEVWHCHHRRRRSAGGRDAASNLLALCMACHAAVHASPAAAKELGRLIAYGSLPSRDVAVTLRDGCWFLADDGTRSPYTGDMTCDVEVGS